MWISRFSCWFEGEIRSVKRCFHSVEWLSGVNACPVLSKEQGLLKLDHVYGSESCHKQRRSLRSSEKELMLLIRLEEVTKPSLKSLDSTKPQSDWVQMEEIQFHCYPPLCWLINRDHSKAEHVIVCEVGNLRAFSHWLMLMFMSPSSGEHWATMECMAELEEQSHCSPKRNLLPVCSLLKIMWTSQRTIGEVFCGRMRPK